MAEEETKIRNIKELGQLVRTFRESAGLSQESAAGLLGVSRKLLSEVETGRKDTIEVGKIFQILHRIGFELKVSRKGRR